MLTPHIVALNRFIVEINWNAIHDTFLAEIFSDNRELVSILGIEPGSYHRLDFLLKDLNHELKKLDSYDFVEIPERIFDYLQFGTPPQSLIDQLNEIEAIA